MLRWVKRWRSIPVPAWTRAAAYFSQSYFEAAGREYRRGLERYPNHKVAPFARLDLSVCFERMGNYEAACEQLAILASQPGPLQQLARIQLCYALLLSDRGVEACKIASSLRLDSRQLRSHNTTELLTVKALSAFDSAAFNSASQLAPERSIGRVKLSTAATSVQAGRRMNGATIRSARLGLGARRRKFSAPRAFALRSANQDGEVFGRPFGLQLIEELRPYRAVHDLVDIVVKLLEVSSGRVESGRDELVKIAEAKNSDGLWLWIMAGHMLLETKEPIRARKLLKRALAQEPRSPRILSLLAATYLVSGEGYNPNFAVQLATKACQHSGWQSARAHAVLAECFYHSGDRLAALTVVQGSRSKLADPQIELLLESLTEQLAS